MVQKTVFAEEIKFIKLKQPLSKSSTLISFNPFLDDDGIVRIGGRLRHACLSFNQKHPIVLPKDNSLTKLIINQAHHITLHGGPTLMQSYIRQKYWIIGIQNMVRKHYHSCITCFRFRSKACQQIMSSLPSNRVNCTRPFLNCGVDYAGPISLRLTKLRGYRIVKGYIAAFVCFSTKAIHIELVSDLSTAAFLAAYRRFVSRRGICANIYSDNGTNFTGADRELKKLLKTSLLSSTSDIGRELAVNNTKWNFIPPGAPHFGGLWEAGVKSIKTHLRRVVGNTLLTFEEMSTLLCQIESCLNSRPLCPLSNDPTDTTVLTPGHFLIGEALNSIPEPNLLEIQEHRLDKWQYLQQKFQHFWRRWSDEYLHRLQQRPKWLKTNRDVMIGDLVILRDEKFPPTKWPVGRITNVYPGSDGHVRVVTVKTNNSTRKLPITKISLLPLNQF